MNVELDRQLLAQIVIILAVCIGGWLMFVEPRVAELRELEATVREASSDPVLMSQISIEQMADQLKHVREHLVEIERQNDFAHDTSEVYGLIMDLAEAHDVVVTQLDPGAEQTDGDGDRLVYVTSFDMTMEGSYEQVAAFLAAVDDLDGFLRSVMLTVTPRQVDDRCFIEARYVCEAVRFALPEALAAMVEANRGDD